ncbi:MAG: ATP-binding protein [Elusimicrobiaceae bacterium]|nr:ATP-binding protein [Elusimicrobiaceae bacterium]
MITNWEIASRVDQATKSIYYTLLMDGNEQDARLIAKKLKGYIKGAQPAQAPYAYAFELPADMDERTQDKVQAAVKEGVELANKVDKFVPGGVLGDPLFNANFTQTLKEFPTFLAPDSSSNSQGTLPPVQRVELDLTNATELNLQQTAPHVQARQVSMPENLEETVAKDIPPAPAELSTTAREVFQTRPPQPEITMPHAPAAPTVAPKDVPEKPADTGTLSISDKDMLLADMEGSVLEKMPLEDILSAHTRYDMFVDTANPSQPQTQQTQKEEKLASVQAEQLDTFDVFEPEVQEPSSTQDVNEVHEITNRLAKKNMDFTNKPTPPSQDAAADASQEASVPQANTPASPQVPFTLGAAQEKKHKFADLSSEELPQEEKLENTLPPQAEKSLPEITIREEDPKILTRTFNLETTFNTEIIRKQQAHNTQARQEGRPTEPAPQTPPHKTVLHLKKPSASVPQAGKTILRLRRKDAPTQPSVPQTLKSTVSAERAAQNSMLAKQKGIDHSIEIPLSELKKHNWPLEVPLVPTYTLNNMVMSVNRFAHATAISVIESPGKLYNPLVLHGGTGTGKTHFLNALAYAFSQKFGQEHVFMTNGVRLSRGIQRYVMEGNIDKFENFMESVRALLIDDIHLLAINEQNRAFISKLLNTFIREQKQIVITSKYPPESLEKLEELIKFKLDSGWISELKPPTGATHFRIVKKMLIENGVDLNDKQIEEFFSAPHMTLGTITRSIRRLKVLENLIFPHVPEEKQSHASIFEKLLATKGEDPTSELATKDPQEITGISTVGNGEWGRIGFFYPQNCADMMNWMVYALEQRAKELGIEGGFDIVVRSSYATENIISSAFKIANLCDNKKLKGAVILGPKPNTCDPSVRENFYDILTHMLEIMLIRCGIINYENVRLPSTYVKVLSELMR